MRVKPAAKCVLVLLLIGTLVSAQQASAESVFTPKGIEAAGAGGTPRVGTMAAPTLAFGGSLSDYRALAADTVETFDVEIEEQKGSGVGKQLVIFAVITAAVAYAVIVLMQSDDEETTEASGSTGKDGPAPPSAARIPVSFTR